MLHCLFALLFATVTVYQENPPVVGVDTDSTKASAHIAFLNNFMKTGMNTQQWIMSDQLYYGTSGSYTVCKYKGHVSCLPGTNLVLTDIQKGVEVLRTAYDSVFDAKNKLRNPLPSGVLNLSQQPLSAPINSGLATQPTRLQHFLDGLSKQSVPQMAQSGQQCSACVQDGVHAIKDGRSAILFFRPGKNFEGTNFFLETFAAAHPLTSQKCRCHAESFYFRHIRGSMLFLTKLQQAKHDKNIQKKYLHVPHQMLLLLWRAQNILIHTKTKI